MGYQEDPESGLLFEEASESNGQEERTEFRSSNLFTSVLSAVLITVATVVLSNLRVFAQMGLGEFEVEVEKDRMKMPEYRARRVKRIVTPD